VNIVFVIADSLRQDHVSCYGWPGCPVETPHIDRLAAESVMLENCYPQGLPTIPVRTEWLTGRGTLPFRKWQPLAKEDLSAPELLTLEGYRTALFTDCYHYFKPEMNLHRGFQTWRWVRGQEYDAWQSGPLRRLRLEDHVNEKMPREWHARVEACLRNLDGCQSADDWTCARLAAEVVNWLDANPNDGRTFLWIDSFDPHEPWMPPPGFDRYVDPTYTGKRYLMPPGSLARQWFSETEIAAIRGLYAGEVAFVDHSLGRVFTALRERGYFDNSVIVFIADHGHPLADHGKFLKGGDRLYSELLKVPCLIRFPGAEHGGRRLTALAQFPDLLPTLLDVAGLEADLSEMTGLSLLPVLRGDLDELRHATISGYHEAPDRAIRDQRWSYVRRPEGEPDELYDLAADPREQRNLIDEYPTEAQRLASYFGAAFALRGAAVKGLQGKYEVAGTAVREK
jgi:arylsulfatase A-like enzyme